MSTSAPLRSRLLTGTVRHRRSRYTEYDFTHSVWYLELDLEEVDAVTRQIRVLSVNRPNILQFRGSDHLESDDVPLAEAVRTRLRGQGLDIDGWRISLVTYPRVLGFVFNPVSFYLCRDRDGALRHVIAEVNNTHGEREVYDFPGVPSSDRSVYQSGADKRMYVSPFIGASARYELRVLDEPDRLRVAISEREGEENTLFAGIQLRRGALTNTSLAKALARDPFVTLKTVALIAWHAWQLKRRGLEWRRHAPRPVVPKTRAGSAQELRPSDRSIAPETRSR